MEEKITLLNDSELDSIVGGAYNQQMISKLGLEVRTASSGAQGLWAEVSYSCTSKSCPVQSAGSSKGWMSDERLRSIVNENNNMSISVKTTSGEMKTLTKNEISKLLS